MDKKNRRENIQKIVYNNKYKSPLKKDGNLKLKEISWEGDSKDILSNFPSEVKQDLGFALWQLQIGERPQNTRSMASIGAGVFEIKESDERSWYRVIYISKIGNTVFVLHCFEKKTRKTEKLDLGIARTRLVQVKKRIAEEEENEK